MPIQTTITDHVYFPDSCKVEYKEDGAASYTDLGAINGDVNAVYNYDVSEHEFANAGKAQTKIKNQSIEATLTLANLNPVNIGKIGEHRERKFFSVNKAMEGIKSETC